jgi:hypothetical protein
MKRIQFDFKRSWLTGLAAAMLVASCGVKQIEDNTTNASAGGRHNNTIYVPEAGRDSNWTRLCSNVVNFTSPGAIKNGLEKYFFSTKNGFPAFPGEVRDLELPVNWCFKIASGGNRAAFRIEYEDHYGGGWYELSGAKNSNPYSASNAPVLFHSEINTSTNQIEVIFLDAQGFTQIIGPKVGDYYEAKIKFANLPSQTDYIDSYVQSIINKCKSGEWNVAQCLGYNFPSTFWWEQQNSNPTSSTLQMAREMLDGGGGAEAGTIGTMRFRLADVLY